MCKFLTLWSEAALAGVWYKHPLALHIESDERQVRGFEAAFCRCVVLHWLTVHDFPLLRA